METIITEYANAKVNLTLEITGKRETGYHELRSLFIPLEFHDFITIKITPGQKKVKLSSKAFRLNNKRNLMYKAAIVFLNKFDLYYDVHIDFVKRIPTQAGLGGGSSDAAAVIRGLKGHFFPDEEDNVFIELCEQLGADVPFCYYNRPALVTGIGEKIEFIELKHNMNVLLIKPRKGLSTKDIFSRIVIDEGPRDNYSTQMLFAYNNNASDLSPFMVNDMEKVASDILADLRKIRMFFYEHGITNVVMSGSGSTMLALIENAHLAKSMQAKFKAKRYNAILTKFHLGDNL